MRATLISDKFIDDYFKNASPSFIIVYILLLRLSRSGGCSIAEAADFLGVMEADIRRALNYWRDLSVISFEEDNGTLKIAFPLEEKAEQGGEADERGTFMPKAAVAAMRPVYSQKEISWCIESNAGLKKLFKACENHMGKLLSDNDMSVLFSLHDWLRMPFDIIELLVSYCCGNGHNSIRYIEKVAVIWADAGINTVEKARSQIKLYNSDFRRIMTALGKGHRDPNKPEEAFMLKWLKDYKLPADVVEAACEKTVLTAARPTFQYADGIIEKWVAAGVKSLEDVERAETEYRARGAEKREKAGVGRYKPAKTKFSNFDERDSTDFSEIERLESERIDKELGITGEK